MSRWSHQIVVGLSMVLVPAVGVLADDPPDARQQKKTLEAEVTTKVTLNYLLYLPDDYEKSDQDWPLLLFLHGAGESGNDLERVKRHGPPKQIAAGKDFPCIVVSPQSPRMGWRPEVLNALLDEVTSKYRVDESRIYVSGISMGGYGTWALAAASPDRFAAIAPICGGGNPADAPKLKGVPAWVFHGARDSVVPLARSEEMVEALKAAGGNVKFTVYPDADHDSWTVTYDNPELYEWLLSQRRPEKGQ